MSDQLKADLMDIHGIGEAKADKILAVLADHDDAPGDVTALLEQALSAHEAGHHAYAAKYVRRALE